MNAEMVLVDYDVLFHELEIFLVEKLVLIEDSFGCFKVCLFVFLLLTNKTCLRH